RTLREKINKCASELVTINEIGVKDEVVYLKS
ncbi:homoserine kinase, partial [Klebsiella quasipneumoniae]|nr:homoserine kinase [Klebsiella quasipneumoniae]